MRTRNAVLFGVLVAVSIFLMAGAALAATPMLPSDHVWAQLPSGVPLTASVSMAPASTYVWAQPPASIPLRISPAQPGSTYRWSQPPAWIPTG